MSEFTALVQKEVHLKQYDDVYIDKYNTMLIIRHLHNYTTCAQMYMYTHRHTQSVGVCARERERE